MPDDRFFPARETHVAGEGKLSGTSFDLIELGAGDCKKSAYLLRHLVRAGAGFTCP